MQCFAGGAAVIRIFELAARMFTCRSTDQSTQRKKNVYEKSCLSPSTMIIVTITFYSFSMIFLSSLKHSALNLSYAKNNNASAHHTFLIQQFILKHGNLKSFSNPIQSH